MYGAIDAAVLQKSLLVAGSSPEAGAAKTKIRLAEASNAKTLVRTFLKSCSLLIFPVPWGGVARGAILLGHLSESREIRKQGQAATALCRLVPQLVGSRVCRIGIRMLWRSQPRWAAIDRFSRGRVLFDLGEIPIKERD